MATPVKKIPLTEEMQLEAIQLYEEKIRRIELQQEKIQPEFDEKLKLLKDVQADFAEVEARMKGYEDEIAMARRRIAHYEGKDGSKIIGFQGEKTKQISWMPYINEAIKKENRFMIFDEIWAALGKNEELVAVANKTVSGFQAMMAPVRNSLETHATNYTSTRKRYVSKFQDKFGLPEWVTLKGKLADPARAKEFITIEQPANVIKIDKPKDSAKPISKAKAK